MNKLSTTIPCPICKTPIPFDAKGLISGHVFNCPKIDCDASISLGSQSKPSIQKTINKLEELKKLK